MRELTFENGRVTATDRGTVTTDDVTECWCCGTPTERPSLCPDCDDAGCNRFTEGCDVEEA